jgi:thioredoxin
MKKLWMKRLWLFLGISILMSALTVNAAEKKLKLPKLMDFGAEKCMACQKLAPILEKMKKEYAGIMDVAFIDVWLKKNVTIAKKYKIKSIPTQIFFDKDGKELWRHVGFISVKDMIKQFKVLGYDIEALKKAKIVKQPKTTTAK